MRLRAAAMAFASGRRVGGITLALEWARSAWLDPYVAIPQKHASDEAVARGRELAEQHGWSEEGR